MRSIWLRRILLLAVFLLLGWVGLYLFGSSGKPKTSERSTPVTASLGEEVVARGEGFDVGVYDENELVFLLSGETVTSDSESKITLQGVHLEVTREGRPYKIWSDSANFSQDNKEAVLEGKVRVEGPDGLLIETEKISLLDKGQRLQSQSPVAFAWGDGVIGKAQRLRSNFESQVHHLTGQVLIRRMAAEESEDLDLEIRAAKISLDREGQLLRADGKVTLHYGESSLAARRLSAHLSEDGKEVRFLHASWNVSSRFLVPGEEGNFDKAVEAIGHSLSVLMDAAGERPEEIELEGEGAIPGILRVNDETGAETTIESPYLSADFRDGLPALVETWGGVTIRQGFSFDPAVMVRMVCADTIDAIFRGEGQFEEMHLRRNVYYHEGTMQIFGDDARVQQGGARVQVTGDPARVINRRADLSAPMLSYTDAAGLVRAEGGVRGSMRDLQDGQLDQTPLGKGDGPLFVEAQEAYLESNNSFAFRDDVRAWRDDALLTAAQLRGNPDLGELSASGQVRTIWSAPVDPEDRGQGPIDVTADQLAYRSNEDLLVYTGNVIAVQQERRLSCDEAKLQLDHETEGSSLKSMDCLGNTEFSDPATGREAVADRALYRPDDKTVELFGEPARWSDSQGRRMEGKRMIYDMETGTVRVRSEVSSPGPGR